MGCSDKRAASEKPDNAPGQLGDIDVVTVFGLDDANPELGACLAKAFEAIAADSENGFLIVHADDEVPETSTASAAKATKADVVSAVKQLDQGHGVAGYDIDDALGLPRKDLIWLLAECVEGGFLRCSEPDDNAATVYWLPTPSDVHQEANQGPSTAQSSPVDEYQNGGSRRQLDLFDRNPNKEE